MNPAYNKVHNRFKLNGIHYDHEALKEVAYSFVKEGRPFERSIGNFLIDWTNHKTFVEVNTSGSTGKPKLIKLKKQAMVNSAIATGDVFKLIPGNKALHCLPANFIAGKMMLVRAIILGLEIDIVEPTSQPIFDNDVVYDFCAMVPMQLNNTKTYINNIKLLIVGGAPVSHSLMEAIQELKTNIFETYGMTETITHIAIKALNGEDTSDIFSVLPNVYLSKDKRDCLIIDAPYLAEESIITNDVVKLISDKEFKWLGRYDNVINSGGVKLYPEVIEDKLSQLINRRIIVTSQKDETLGTKVVLVVEGETFKIESSVFDTLDTYEKPKEIYFLDTFKETPSKKIKRKKTLAQLKE